MKSSINRKIISLMLTIILIVSIGGMPAYATEMTPPIEEEPTVSTEAEAVEESAQADVPNELEEVPEIELEQEEHYEPLLFDWDLYYDAETGQIDGNKFTTAGEGVYPLILSAKVIDNFDEDCYIYLTESEHKARRIRIDLIPANNFTETIYLPAGYYQVIETGAKNAETLTFKETVTAVSLGDSKESLEIQIILNNAENVVKNNLGVWQDKSFSEEVNNNILSKTYGIEALKGVQANMSGVLYYPTTHIGARKVKFVDKEVEVIKEGQKIIEIQQVEEVYYDEPGLGYVTAYGNSIKDADVILEITKGGVVGQAEFKVSYDGGTTYYARFYTGEEVIDPNIGLTYNFYTLNDNDELKEGDIFTFHAIESFEVENSSGSEIARITCVGHPINKHELVINILSSGGRGISRIKITDKKNNMETKTYLIPENGIVELDDNLTIYFENIEGYVKGVEYKINIVSHDVTINYTPVIALGIGMFILLVIGLFWLLMKKEKRGDYMVHQYTWKQDESAYE